MNPLTARDPLSQRILDLTLEMIFLLTGEGHMVVKIHEMVSDSSRHQISEGHGRSQSFNTEPSPHSGIHEQNHEKILELSNQIICLLTGEVPIRCEDVTVYLSMEEWEYVERHKELYEYVMMEDHQPVITRGKSVSRDLQTFSDFDSEYINNCGENYLNKTRKGRAESATYTERESLASEERHVREKEIYPITEPSEYSPPDIKEEPASCDEGNLPDSDMYEPPEHTQTECSADNNGEYVKSKPNPVEINHSESLIESRKPDHTYSRDPLTHKSVYKRHSASSSEMGKVSYSELDLVIHETNSREEPFSNMFSGENSTMKPALTHQYDYTEERPFSCFECGKYFTDSIALINHQKTHTDINIKEEPASCDEGNLTVRDMYEPPEHTQTEYPSTDIKEESPTYGEGNLTDSDMYEPPEHTQTEYPSTDIKDESPTYGEGNLTDSDMYEPPEHTQTEYPSTDIKEESPTYGEGNLTDSDMYEPPEQSQTEYLLTDIKAEPDSCEEHNIRNTGAESDTGRGDISHPEIYPLPEHFKAEYVSVVIKEEPASCEEGNLPDSDMYEPPEHTQTEYPSVIKKESHTWEEGNLTYLYKTEEPTECSADNNGEYVKSNPNPVEINHSESLIESRIPDNSIYYIDHTYSRDPLTHSSVHQGHSASSSEMGKVSYSESDPVIHETKCKEEPISTMFSRENSTTKLTHQHNYTERRFSCPECGKCFTNASNLKQHKIIHKVEKIFTCTGCGKCFTQASHLAQHRKIHAEERPYICNECGKCFRWASQLVVHKRTHTFKETIKCDECGKCFKVYSSLARHKRIHTGEKLIKCEECGKCFNGALSLASHKRIHIKEIPFKCNECGKYFTEASNLARHKMIHTGVKPFICTECGKCFLHASSLSRHTNDSHAIKA